VMKQPANKGEYYLTDAFQYMIDKGARIKVVDVEGWYDAGKLDTLLDTNRAMLERGRARKPASVAGSTIIDPVYIEEGVVLNNATVGPNVSLHAGAVIVRSTLRDTIVGSGSKITDCRLSGSLIGEEVVLEGVRGEVTIGDQSEVHAGTA
jgi:glucose-1-phosphate thymidylyltransferase